MQDQAILYNSLYIEIKDAISNIKTLGFDVDAFSMELNTIHNEVSNNVKTNYVKGMAEASLISFYTSGIKRLNILKNKLDYFDIYFKVYHTCKIISSKLNDNITKDELDKIVSQIIYILTQINKSSTMDYDMEKSIVDKAYEVAYNVIKYEILLTGQSTIYDFVTNTDMNKKLFDSFIIRDIEAIDLKKKENKQIELKISSILKNGIYSSYFDLELIKLILIYNKKYDLKTLYNRKIKDLVDEICASNEEIFSSFNEYKSLESSIKSNNDNIKACKKDLSFRIPIITLILGGYIFGGVLVAKLGKNINMKPTYSKTTKTYSTINDEYNESQEIVLTHRKPEDKTTLTMYSKSDNTSRRYFYQYDISDFNLDLNQSFNINKKIDSNDITGEIIDLKPINEGYIFVDNYKNSYMEIISDSYEDLGYKSFDEDGCIMDLIFLYILYILLLVLVTLGLSEYIFEDTDMVLDTLKRHKNYNNQNYTKLEYVVDKLMTEISKNDELKEQFDKLYKENLFLLKDHKELQKRINEIDLSEIKNETKKLVKKY